MNIWICSEISLSGIIIKELLNNINSQGLLGTLCVCGGGGGGRGERVCAYVCTCVSKHASYSASNSSGHPLWCIQTNFA